MRSKKGQLFSLWIVILTLFLCGISIALYNVQQEKVAISLVSPLAVLEVRDNLSVFEMREEELMMKSLESVSSNFGSDEFVSEFRGVFLSGLTEDMKEFLLSDLVQQGVDDSTKQSFFENVVYPKVGMDGGKMRFVRGKIGKSFILKSGDWNIVNFPVEVEFEFEKEYLISKRGNEFAVEVVE